MNLSNIDTSIWDFTDDRWGGIDKEIKNCVIVLNLLGVRTVGSCAGHVESNNIMPYISVSSFDVDENDEESWDPVVDDEFRRVVTKYLDEFYKGRNADGPSKIVIEDVKKGFEIRNGGHLWYEWRKQVDERVAKIKRGEKAERYIYTNSELEERKTIRGKLIKEFNDFAEFLFIIYKNKVA